MVLIIFALCNLLHADYAVSSTADGWIRLSVPKEKKFLFFAIEEAEPFRLKYGDWQPEGVLAVKSDYIDIKVNKLERKSNKINYTYTIKGVTENIIKSYTGTFTDAHRNINSFLDLSFYYEISDGILAINIPCEKLESYEKNADTKQSNRRIIFCFGSSINEFKLTYKVSRAVAGFDWSLFSNGTDEIK